MTIPTPRIHPVYAVVGRDRFLRNEAMEGILRSAAKPGDGLGPVRTDGADAQLADVLDEVRTPSLLGDRRVVVVDEADDFISASRAALERYCASPAESGCLILVCETLAKNTRLYKILAETGSVVACEPPSGRAVVGWVVRRARDNYGKRLSELAAQRLRDHLGDSPGWLDSELAKLTAYVGERGEITPTDIDALTGDLREEKVFAVMDAVASGDVAAALGHWQQVLATDRAAPGRAIAGLAWAVRRLLEARRDWEAGVDLRELARRMFTDASVLQRRLEGLGVERLMEQQRDLLAADLAVKTGASTIEVAVEKFIVKHSTGGGAARALAC